MEAAKDIRRVLGIDQALRQSVRSWSEYLSALTRIAEAAGILVMRSSVVGNTTRRKVTASEVKGFAIYDPVAPLVFVNSDDFKASQIFTLLHELAHIWIGQSALSNPEEADAGKDAIESFCNRVAAEALVPHAEFLKLWEEGQDEEVLVGRLAKWFLVSSLVILRRAHESGKISGARFAELKQKEFKKQTKAAGGGDYYRNVVARMGSNLTYAVLGEVQARRIILRDAARLLDMKVNTLLKFAETAR